VTTNPVRFGRELRVRFTATAADELFAWR